MNRSDKNRRKPKIQRLNLQQANELFENTVQLYLNITADEFMKRYRDGEYKNVCNNSRILKLLMMIPANR